MIFQDIVALAKAGWTPKQIKEVLEMVESSPKVADAKVDEVVDKKPEAEAKTPEVEPKAEVEATDDIATLVNILKEE